MQKISETLQILQKQLPAEVLSKVLPSLLRVPEAFAFLTGTLSDKQPAFLQKPDDFLPGNLAAHVLQVDSEARDPDEETARSLLPVPPDADFTTLAHASLDLAARLNANDAVSGDDIHTVANDRKLRSLLALAFNRIESPGEYVKDAFAGDDEALQKAWVNAILANMSPGQAAQWVEKHVPNHGKLMLELRMQKGSQLEDPPVDVSDETTPSDPLSASQRLIAYGKHDVARNLLQSTWQNLSRQIASIADRMGDLAELEQDLLTTVEARREALEIHPTALRRARWIRSLLDNGQIAEATSQAQGQPVNLEEQIAFGLVSLANGDLARASDYLKAASMQLRAQSSSPRWILLLADGLQAVGAISDAIEVYQRFVEVFPADSETRTKYAVLLSEAGDAYGARQEAFLSSALAPDSLSNEVVLAQSLQATGNVEKALSVWQELASEHPIYNDRVAECAIQLGDLSRAEVAVSGLLTGNKRQKSLGHILLGHISMARNDHQQARASFDRAVDIDPENADAWIALAQAQFEIGDRSAAEKTLTGAIQRQPELGSLHAALGAQYHAEGRLTDALTSINRAVQLDTDDPDYLLARGQILLDLGQWTEAKESLKTVWEKKPRSWNVQIALAQAHEQAGELAAAKKLIENLPPHLSGQAYLDAGRILAKSIEGHDDGSDTLEESYTLLDRAIESDASPARVHYWKGYAAEYAGEWDQALRHYQDSLREASELRDVKLDALLGYARSANKLDRPSLAVKALLDARDQFPASTTLLGALSESYLHAGETAHALSMANQALELAPRDKSLLRLASRCAQANANDELAEAALKKLTSIDPEDASAWLDYARLGFERGNVQVARKAVATAITCNRKDTESLMAAAQVLGDVGLFSSTRRILRHTIDRGSPSSRQVRKIASMAEVVGDLELAHRIWQGLVEENPEDVEALNRCADALWSLQRRSSAIGLWQRALAIEPDNAHIHQMLGRALDMNGEHEASLTHYAKALEFAPDRGELALEAGLASLKQQHVADAMERLQTAALLMPGNLDAALGLIECKLAMGSVVEAHEALLNVSLEGNAPSRAFSMLAIASAAQGDLPSAEAALEQAFAQPFVQDEDALWAYRASFRLMHWERGIEALEMGMRREQSLTMLATLTSAYLEMSMAYWTVSSIGHADVHAPSLPSSPEVVQKHVEQLLSRVGSMDAPASWMDALTCWSTLLFNLDEPTPEIPTLTSSYQREINLASAIRNIRSGSPMAALSSMDVVHSGDMLASLKLLVEGYAHAVSGNTVSAIQYYEQAGNDPIIAPLSHYLTASALLTEGRQDAAIASLNDALTQWPEEHRWHYELASLYLDSGQADAALPHLQEAVEQSPEQADYRHTLARSLYQAGDLSGAAFQYEHILELKPDAPLVWKEAGQAALAVGNAEQAAAWFERACTLLPSDPACLVGAAQALLLQNKVEQALDRAESALRMAPSNPDALMAIGDIYSRLDRLDDALETYDHAITQTSEPVPVHVARGRLLLKQKRLDDALDEMQTALRAFPESEIAWSALAEMYEELGQLDHASDAASRLVNLAPHNASYRMMLGRICRKQGHLDRAMNELLVAEKIAPLNIELVLELGTVFEERRELQQAIRCYERASSIDPSQPESMFRSGLLFKQMKQYAEAVDQFKKAAELDPRNPDIHHQLAAVHALQLVHGLTPEIMVTQ